MNFIYEHEYYTNHKVSLFYIFTVEKYNYLLKTSACASLKQSEHIVSLHALHIKTDYPCLYYWGNISYEGDIFLGRQTHCEPESGCKNYAVAA